MTWLQREYNWAFQSTLLLVRDPNRDECCTAIEWETISSSLVALKSRYSLHCVSPRCFRLSWSSRLLFCIAQLSIIILLTFICLIVCMQTQDMHYCHVHRIASRGARFDAHKEQVPLLCANCRTASVMILLVFPFNDIYLQGSANDKLQSSVPDSMVKAKHGEKLEKVWGNSRSCSGELPLCWKTLKLASSFGTVVY